MTLPMPTSNPANAAATTATTAAIERRLQASQLRMAGHHPFFASLLLMAPTVVTDAFETAATDGVRLFFNPSFVAPLTSMQLDGLMVHELLHCALQHGARRGSRDALLWNIAADIHVNGIIRALKHLDLPPGGVEEPKLAHLSVDEIYAALVRSARTGVRLGGHGTPALRIRDVVDPADPDPAALARVGAFWSDAMQRARAVARARGTGMGAIPAHVDRVVDDLQAPRLDWRTALWRHVVRTPDDFAGFDRRHVWQGLYVEELQGDGLEVDVCIDTSGSVDDGQLREFLGELRGILGAYPTVRCRLYYADAACTGPFDVAADRPLPVAKGGGGTDFRPFFLATAPGAGGDAAEAAVFGHADVPRLAVYLTDGCGTFPQDAPDRPVLWVVTPGGTGEDRFPFGEVVRMVGSGDAR